MITHIFLMFILNYKPCLITRRVIILRPTCLTPKVNPHPARTEGAPSREVYVAATGRHVIFTDPVQRDTATCLLSISFAPPRETTFVSVNLAPGKMVAVAAQIPGLLEPKNSERAHSIELNWIHSVELSTFGWIEYIRLNSKKVENCDIAVGGKELWVASNLRNSRRDAFVIPDFSRSRSPPRFELSSNEIFVPFSGFLIWIWSRRTKSWVEEREREWEKNLRVWSVFWSKKIARVLMGVEEILGYLSNIGFPRFCWRLHLIEIWSILGLEFSSSPSSSVC